MTVGACGGQRSESLELQAVVSLLTECLEQNPRTHEEHSSLFNC